MISGARCVRRVSWLFNACICGVMKEVKIGMGRENEISIGGKRMEIILAVV